MGETSLSSDKFHSESRTVSWRDGLDVFTKRWIPNDLSTPRALIIFLHGFAEHVERYDHVWPLCATQGFEVFGYDQRGFGKSGPRYGDTTLEQQLVDLEYAIQTERERLDERHNKSKVPIFLYGHSLGGGIILSLMTRARGTRDDCPDVRNMISGVICGAPWILRTNPPSGFLLRLVPYIAWLYPNLPMTKALNPHHLTSDSGVAERIQSDPLFRGDIYIKTVSGMLLEGYRILSEGYKNWPGNMPILITHGERDPSTSSEASRKFIDKLKVKDKEFKPWPDMLHEGHNERLELRDPFLDYSIRWFDKRAPILKDSSS